MDATAKIIGMIAIVVIVVAGLAMTPVVVDEVQDMNTTGWTFTGSDGAITLLGLVPFIWIASILVMGAVGMFGLARAPSQVIDLVKNVTYTIR